MKFFSVLLLSVIFLTPFSVSAEADGAEQLKQALAKSMPNVKPDKITRSPVEGLYQVVIGTQVVYMSVDAQYMIEGDLYNLKTKKNITEDAKSTVRLKTLKELGTEQMVIYRPDEVKDVITVITDIDCPYCRRLHEEVPDYMKLNVEVRYVFMPLKGAEDMKKTISVWCSDDQQLALDIAKAGGEVEEKKCDNPIKKHLNIARDLGIRGTPAIILEDGKLLPGYVPYDKLIAELRK